MPLAAPRPCPAPPVAGPPRCAGVAVLDDDDRIVWIDPALAALLEAGEAAVGRRIDTLPEAAAGLLDPQPAPCLWTDAAGNQRWLRAERIEADGRRLLLLLDLGHEQALRRRVAELKAQVDELALTDALTGLPNRRAILQALELQTTRSRRYGNALSVLLVEARLEEPVEPLGEAAAALALTVSRFLRDRLRWVDQIGRLDDDRFLVLLPETGRTQAELLLRKLRAAARELRLPPALLPLHPRLRFGLSGWTRGLDPRALLQRAEHALRRDD